jgi:hypothetical protein
MADVGECVDSVERVLRALQALSAVMQSAVVVGVNAGAAGPMSVESDNDNENNNDHDTDAAAASLVSVGARPSGAAASASSAVHSEAMLKLKRRTARGSRAKQRMANSVNADFAHDVILPEPLRGDRAHFSLYETDAMRVQSLQLLSTLVAERAQLVRALERQSTRASGGRLTDMSALFDVQNRALKMCIDTVDYVRVRLRAHTQHLQHEAAATAMALEIHSIGTAAATSLQQQQPSQAETPRSVALAAAPPSPYSAHGASSDNDDQDADLAEYASVLNTSSSAASSAPASPARTPLDPGYYSAGEQEEVGL